MSADVTHSEEFGLIYQFDPEKNNYATGKHSNTNAEKISAVAENVTQYLQSTDFKIDTSSIPQFIEKLGAINEQFESSGQETSFSTAICSLNLLMDLRKGLSSENQEIVGHPFLTELDALLKLDAIGNKSEVAKKLYQFQKEILSPALEDVKTLEELEALKPLTGKCILLKAKVDSIDKNGVLEKLKTQTIDLFKMKGAQVEPLYQSLLSYTKGSTKELDQVSKREKVVKRLTAFVAKFIPAAHLLSLEEKVSIYQALLDIQGEFEEHGDGERLDPVITSVSEALGLVEDIKSSFALELKALSSNEVEGPHLPVLQKLVAFERDVLSPAIQSCSSRETLLALEPLVDQCIALKAKVEDVDEQDVLYEMHENLIGCFNARFETTNTFYRAMVSYKRGNISDLDKKERRQEAIKQIQSFIEGIIPDIDHPMFLENDKKAIYQGIITLQAEFEEYGDGKLFNATLKTLSEALGISPKSKSAPKEELFSSVGNIRAMWQQKAEKEGEPSRSTRTLPVKRKEVSPEVRREKCFSIIQEKIGRLDLHGPRLKGDITDIKREIETLRKLPGGSSINFSHLDNALTLLVNPSSLRISAEESLFMSDLGKRHHIEESDFFKYSELQDSIILEAQSTVLKALKKGISTPEKLEAVSNQAMQGLREKVMKDRFQRFTSTFRLNPALNHNFSTHFPALVSAFELFTHEIVEKRLEKKWQEIESQYDSVSEGRFSGLLAQYSYMNPRQQFPLFTQHCQQSFLASLDLALIDQMEAGELSTYLEEKVESSKTEPGKLFEINYMDLYSAQHLWMLENIISIKKPYNQGDAIHTNTSNGVCYNCSLSRMAQLLSDPDLSTESIQMGSNQKIRYNQSRVREYFRAAKRGEITFKAAVDEEIKNAGEYGLKLYHTYHIPAPAEGDLHEFLAGEMVKYGEAGHTQFLFSLYSLGGAHAFNVQLDPKKKMYRFMDENLGLCEFKSRKAFKKEVGEYLKHFYPEYKSYEISVFQKA